jgi:hypothetical protein
MTTEAPNKPDANAEAAKSTRGRKAGIPAKPRPPIPNDQFAITIPSADTRVKFKRRREERGAQQEAVDDLVAAVYTDWVKAGKPFNWADMPSRVWPVGKTHADNAQFMLRKACTLHGRRLYSGNIEHGKCVDANCPCQNKPDGLTHIPFCVMDMREKKDKTMTVDKFLELADSYGIDLQELADAIE